MPVLGHLYYNPHYNTAIMMQLGESYVVIIPAFLVYLSFLFRCTPLIIIISMSHKQQYLLLLHDHTLLEPINYWLCKNPALEITYRMLAS